MLVEQSRVKLVRLKSQDKNNFKLNHVTKLVQSSCFIYYK